jgi:hypothetical protein
MKRFFFYSIILFFFLFLLFFFLIAFFNYIIDPHSVFRISKFSQENHIVINFSKKKISNINKYWNDNTVRKLQIANSYIGDCAVIGSSRVLKISSEILNCATTNFGVGASGLEDKIAIINSILKMKEPKTIIINIDPWMFSSNYNHLQSVFISQYLETLENMDTKSFLFLHKTRYRIRQFHYLLKAETTILSLKYFYYFINNKNYFEVHNFTDHFSYNSDGTLVYPFSYESKNEKLVNDYVKKQYVLNSKEYLKENIPERDYKFSLYKYNLFIDYVNVISTKSQIILLILPYHPYAYKEISVRNKSYFEIEKIIKNYNFKKSNVKVLGSYNPEFMCSEKDFYDDKHLKGSCLKSLFNKLYLN